MICNKNENKEDDKTEKTAFTKSGNLLDGVPLVAKSPPSDTEASLPVTGSTPDGSSKHDLSACTSSSLENENASKMESDKAHNCSENKRLNCIRSSRKKRVHKEFHKANLFHELSLLPRIHTITIGDFELEPLYTSPLPLELVKKGHLYICENCLDFKESKETLERHTVDGNIAKDYSQNLCLLAKLFIDHKTLFYDVEPFLFYVLTIWNSTGCHLADNLDILKVRIFFQQKCSLENNLSCILTLPSYQNKGYGRFLIDFSFLLSRREGITGTPERPLSDMGNLAYRSYWRSIVLEYFKRPSSASFAALTLEDIAKTTGVSVEDIMQTMKDLEMLHIDQNGEINKDVEKFNSSSKLSEHGTNGLDAVKIIVAAEEEFGTEIPNNRCKKCVTYVNR
ncbi:hypothetical protein X798_04216 [Onchocerca flexuosa]|uniref:Histone acetyltransferase n=1 Tax=Onchocerca flexuosa TaxID=387005 RepID=A0A238BTX6_9BILA|nr:hypothetical protein X798_04216 [Onchocerca flexuosa]